MIPEERMKAALAGPYADEVQGYLAQDRHGDVTLGFGVLLRMARYPAGDNLLSGYEADEFRCLVRAAAGFAGVTLGGEVPASRVEGIPLSIRQEAALASVASFGITGTAAGSFSSLSRRGLAVRVPGWTWESPEEPWHLTEAGLIEAQRALIIAAKPCRA